MERARRGRSRAAALFAATAAVVSTLPLPHRAQAFDRTFNISLLSEYTPPRTGTAGDSHNNIYADLWAEGNVVVMGSVNASTTFGRGVSIIDTSTPVPTSVEYSPAGTAGGQFRDIIVRNNIGYFAIDDGSSVGGIHIVNLANPASPSLITTISPGVSFQHCHDLFIDGNQLYVASNLNTTIKVFNLTNPASPTFIRSITTTGTTSEQLHDMTVQNGRMFTSNLTTGLVEIYDVSNVATAPAGTWTAAGHRLGFLNPGVRTHSSWASADGSILAVAREDTGTDDNMDVTLWNISNPATPVKTATIKRDQTLDGNGNFLYNTNIDSYTPHNPVIIGDTLYVSWYQAGLQIFNIRNPSVPAHMGAYDTFVGGNGSLNNFAGVDGNWGVFPFFGPQKILLSDFDKGLVTVDATAAFKRPWTYGADNAGKWQDNGKWGLNVGVFPNSSEMTAQFTDAANGGATRTVTVDGSLAPVNPRVAGIEFNSAYSYTVAASNGGEIQLKNSGGAATITLQHGNDFNGVNRITCPIELVSDLTVTNSAATTSAPTLELGAIRGTDRTMTFVGPGFTALTAASPNFTGSINVNSGTLSLRNAGATHAQAVTLNGGTLRLENDSSTNFASDVAVAASANLRVGNIAAGTGQTHSIRDLFIASNRSLTFTRANSAHLAARNVTVSGTLTVAQGAGGGTARFDTLNIPGNGKLNLGDGSLVLTNTSVASATALLANGRNGGSWDGVAGIGTTAPLSAGTFAIGVASADDTGRTGPGANFGGISVSATDTLVMYTYAGDANLDGKVTISDYGKIDFGITIPGASGWFNGDFNYDGKITISDYGAIDFAIGTQGPPISTAGDAGVGGLSVVPEPASLALLAAGLPFATRRRARRSKSCSQFAAR